MASLMHEFGAPNFKQLGPSALVVELDGPPSLELQSRLWHLAEVTKTVRGVIERVCGLSNLTIIFNPTTVNALTLKAHLTKSWSTHTMHALAPCIEIPVRYGGEYGLDLARVAQASGLREAEVIERHAGVEYTVYFVGFQPGFAYLGDLDPKLVTPRLDSPRARVPAGTVAIGGTHTAVYPFASPGGWNLIGKTDLTMFDVNRKDPALLARGSRVKFVVSK
jgi:KipI family sensor histidine kinase inhibitor